MQRNKLCRVCFSLLIKSRRKSSAGLIKALNPLKLSPLRVGNEKRILWKAMTLNWVMSIELIERL